jgi:uncharacterized NAD-dependent epimerase/dehydratase family protein
VILSAPLNSAPLFCDGVAGIGFGGGLITVGTKTAAMALTRDGQSGLGRVCAGVGLVACLSQHPGGQLPHGWIPTLVEALKAGLDVVSGMHTRLERYPELVEAARTTGAQLINVRHSDSAWPIGTGSRPTGRRLLTVGTDCALGKKYTALAIARALTARGVKATFRATGQTGILIAGHGVAIDAVVSDFVAGAAETLSPANDANHWDVVEGQGALFHPAYAGVTLGLLHGSQPDAIVLCHDPSRETIEDHPHIRLPTLHEAIRRYIEAGSLTNPAIRCVGVAINSSTLSDAHWTRYRDRTRADLQLPVCDPLRGGVEPIVEALMA